MFRMFFRKYWLTLSGIILGTLGGFLYWKFVGCTGGSCPITSSPLMSSLWGAALGGLLFSMFKKDHKKGESTETGIEV